MADVRSDIPYGAHVGLVLMLPFRIGLFLRISFGIPGAPGFWPPLLRPFAHLLYFLRTVRRRPCGCRWAEGMRLRISRRPSHCGLWVDMARKLIAIGLLLSRSRMPPILQVGPASCFVAASAPAQIGQYLIRNRSQIQANRRWASSKRQPPWELDGHGSGYRHAPKYIPRAAFAGYPKSNTA